MKLKHRLRDLLWEHNVGNRYGNYLIKKLGGYTERDMSVAVEKWTALIHRYEEEARKEERKKLKIE